MESVDKKNMKNNETGHETYETMSKKDLIDLIQQQEAHIRQLRNIIAKTKDSSHKSNKRKEQRLFDFNKYNKRHVALKIAYLGWDYQGLAVQEDTAETIEGVLFDALLKTRLIESRETSCYHRCGRTDKGVSAFGQVISIDLRTNLLEGKGVKVREGGTAAERNGEKTIEIRYAHLLNKVLPAEVRVLAWCPVDPDFSARFSCRQRIYKYYFPKGDLNVDLMREAACRLVGEHDFRNLCKMDVAHGVTNFIRKIMSTDIQLIRQESPPNVSGGYDTYELTVVGQAFLWHQIRCIVALLFLIGQGKESVHIIDKLFDVDTNPRKPQYTMASELPLVLFDCEYDDLEWIYEEDWHEYNMKVLQEMWTKHSIKATMLQKMLVDMSQTQVHKVSSNDKVLWSEGFLPVLSQPDCLNVDAKKKSYTPLMQRELCESLEDRIDHFVKRRKIADPREKKNEVDGSLQEEKS